MRTHDFDQFTGTELARIEAKRKRYARARMWKELGRLAVLAVVFGMIGAMLAYRG